MEEDKDCKTLQVVFQVEIYHRIHEVKWLCNLNWVSLSVTEIISVFRVLSKYRVLLLYTLPTNYHNSFIAGQFEAL